MKTRYSISLEKFGRMSKVKDVVKVFPVSLQTLSLTGGPLSVAWKKILSLSMGRIAGLRNRLVITNNFIKLVCRISDSNGANFTIKWLKACYVALQKAQAGDYLPSLRTLEPGLPLPRLVNGVPAFIGPKDRALIRQGHPSVIRFWSSLLSVYRVLQCSYKLKVNTITDPFTGCVHALEAWCRVAEHNNVFSALDGYNQWRQQMRIAPQVFLWGQKASPRSKVAWHGILTELCDLLPRDGSVHPIMKNMEVYLDVLHSAGHNTNVFRKRIEDGWQVIMNIFQFYTSITDVENARKCLLALFPIKTSSRGTFGQISLKEEAAGKLRVFAMVDNLTQSILRPLHDALFGLLRLIPNDGTFDQDASVRRSADKASKYGCAYSFDLSAATDRLPAAVSAKVLSNLSAIPGLGEAWLQLLVDRKYWLNSEQEEQYQSPVQYVRYSVGQPMGALSSWAMLAVTHHWILQMAARKPSEQSIIIQSRWEDRYEILGDDLTIFDKDLADRYLIICRQLGVEINMSKSIVSPSKPVFEFAKRTYNSGVDVSPIPFKSLINASLADSVGLFLQNHAKGLVTGAGLFKRLVSRFGTPTRKELVMPILAILGALVSKKQVPHRWLVESLVDPNDDEFDFDESSLQVPLESSIKLILHGQQKEMAYPFSNQETRSEFFDDYEDEFANVVANRALLLARRLEVDYDSVLSQVASKAAPIRGRIGSFFAAGFFPKVVKWDDRYINDRLRMVEAQVTGFMEENFLNWDRGLDVTEAVDEIETDPKFYYRRGLTLDHANAMLERIEVLDYHFRIDKVKDEKSKPNAIPRAEVVASLGKVIKGTTSKYWSVIRPV